MIINKRKIFFVTLFFLFAKHLTGQTHSVYSDFTVKSHNLIGKVKKVQINDFFARELNNNKIEKNLSSKKDFFFNKKGNIDSIKYYYADNKIEKKYIFQFNNNNQITSLKALYNNEFYQLLSKYSDKLLTEEIISSTNPNGSNYKVLYKYNSNKQLIYKDFDNGESTESIKYLKNKKEIIKKNGRSNYKEIELYNGNSLVEKKVYKTNNDEWDLIENLNVEYDRDTILEKTFYYKNDEIESIQNLKLFQSKLGKRKDYYTYDKNKNLKSISKYLINSNGVKRTLEVSKYENGKVSSGKYFSYDNKGNILKDSTYTDSPYSNVYKASYEYDKYGNWTKKLVYRKNKIFSILTQTIEYYK